MKIGIATVCTEEVQPYGELFVSQLRSYALRHGYGLHICEENPNPDRHILLARYPFIRGLIDEYDWLFWTDVDCFLESPQIRLESFIMDDAELILSTDLYSINTGHFLLKNCTRSKQFLDAVDRCEESDHPTKDQAMVHNLLRENPWRIRWRLNGDLFNGHHLQSGRFFLRHLFGEPASYRVAYHNPGHSPEALWLESFFQGRRGRYLEVCYKHSKLDGLLKRGWRGVLNLNTDQTLQPWWEDYDGWGHFSAHPATEEDEFDLVCIHERALRIPEYRRNLSTAAVVMLVGRADEQTMEMVKDMGFIRMVHRTPDAIMLCRPRND